MAFRVARRIDDAMSGPFGSPRFWAVMDGIGRVTGILVFLIILFFGVFGLTIVIYAIAVEAGLI